MAKKITNEEFLQRLKNRNIEYTPLEEYRGSDIKIKWQCYKESTHVFEMRPRAIIDKQGCPYCSGNKLLIGYNDCWTTRPDIAIWLKNPEDGYSHFCQSHKNVYWICPNCKTEIYKSFHQVASYGLACHVCGDGISYPEKIVMSILNQLGIDYLYNKSYSWSNKKQYDFYLYNYNTIIETHGEQHYSHGFSCIKSKNKGEKKRTLREEQANDIYKKELALSNGINHYIELDCRKSELHYIKNSVLISELNNLFNLSNIDWIKCESDARKTLYSDILNCWNEGIKNTVDIAQLLNLNRHTVQKYLKIASNYNLCDYDAELALKNGREKAFALARKKVICMETQELFDSIQHVSNILGVSHSCVSSVCRGERKSCGGYHWMFYDDYLALKNKGGVI